MSLEVSTNPSPGLSPDVTGALESMSDAFVALDPEWRIQYWNAQAERLFGVDRSEALGETLWKTLPALAGSDLEIAARNCMATRFKGSAELVYRPRATAQEARIFPTPSGGLNLFFRDLTPEASRVGSREERRYRSLTEASTAVVWETDTSGCMVPENQIWQSLTGQTSKECQGWGWIEAIHPDDQLRAMSDWRNALENQTYFQTDFRLRNYDGVYRHVIARAVPDRDEDGAIIGWFGACTDIDKPKRTEALLAGQSRALSRAADGSPIEIVMADVARSIERQSDRPVLISIHLLDRDSSRLKLVAAPSFSDKFAALFSESTLANAEDWEAATVALDAKLLQPLDVLVPAFGDRIRDAAQQRGLRRVWPTLVRSSNNEFLGVILCFYPDSLDPSPHEAKAVTLLAQTVALIAEGRAESWHRRAAELSFRASEEKFHDLADNMSQFAWMADANGDVFWFNKRWFEYTGTTLEEVAGWGWTKVHHPEHVDRVVQQIKRCWETGEDWEDTFPLRGKDGNYRWFLSRALPIRDENGRILRWFGTNTDVTKQRDMEKELLEADRLKDEFLAALAHELRNPLAPLRNGLEIVQSPDLDGDHKREVFGMMERQLMIMVRQIDDLLDISRISLGRFKLHRGVHSLAEIINSAVETSLSLIEQKQHTLSVKLPEQPIFVEGDNLRLCQVLANLLNNAAKYTPVGGSISIEVEPAEQKVRIAVRDNGIGISKSDLKGIFDKFWRADYTLERSQGGLGIGLSIAKSLVEMHGGIIEACSDGPKTGSAFSVTLPIARHEPAEQTLQGDRAKSPPSHSAPRKKVLVVDDNEDAARTLSMMIQLQGSEVHTAHDGLEAVRKAEAIRPDLILLDLGMPVLNGYKACELIRSGPLASTVKIVALSGWGQTSDKRRAEEAGFDRHLTKPVEPTELIELVRAL